MKKILAIVIALFIALFGVACASDKTTDNPVDGGGATDGNTTETEGPSNKTPLKVFAPDGAPAFALSGLMENSDYDIEVVASNTIGSKITGGEADLVIAPTNAIVNLFNKGKDYRIIAGATRGNLFIVGVGSGDGLTLADLVGSVVGVIGQGQTPDLVLRYILESNSVDYAIADAPVSGKVGIRYYADGPSVIKAVKAGQAAFGLLGEPAATNAVATIEDAEMLDVQELYRQAEDGNSYGFPQAVLAVKYETYTARKSDVDAFVTAYAAAENFAEENPAKAVELVKAHMTEGVAASIQSLSAETARRCNISGAALTQQDKADINAYMQLILDLEAEDVASGAIASSVGGKLPDDSIYIIG